MKFNKKVPFWILIICLLLTLVSVYQEHEKKALYGNAQSFKMHDSMAHIKP
ncbi:MAG: hypothetical protein QF513_00835 [Gammaproteobacteria bacterium]|jgi:hypothetical protein|nr:hypothetical protein [Gammaproteobacteria bacterium]HJM08869.1 hypothetical protein [Gammaproteobacteria bacterium]|tara:strand:+ start:9470 stop:9622 length:153 start_codon:yes stop_codon:yes gene_type:complete